MVHYISNGKTWIRTEITENVLGLLDRKLGLEGENVIFFLHNAPCHQEVAKNILFATT